MHVYPSQLRFQITGQRALEEVYQNAYWMVHAQTMNICKNEKVSAAETVDLNVIDVENFDNLISFRS